MSGYEFCSSYWWMFPLEMMLFCILFMRKGCGRMMCGFGSRDISGESAIEILNKRYVTGEIDQREYEERKRVLQNH